MIYVYFLAVVLYAYVVWQFTGSFSLMGYFSSLVLGLDRLVVMSF